MSEENVEIVRRMWDAFLAGDVPAALSFYAPDVEWDGTNLPDGRIGRGHQAILDHVARWAGVWDDWTVEVERVHEVGSDQVVLFMREKGRSDNGLTMDERHAELYTLREGMIVRRQGFSDPSQALEAVGLSEEATSQENVESVLRGVDAFNRRDVEAFAALGTPDVEVVPMRAAVEAISYRGPEGVAQFFAETDEIWDAISVELSERPTQVDDRTIYASGRLRGRGHDSGIDVDMEVAWVFRFRDGLISSSRTYADVARAREDAGLSE